MTPLQIALIVVLVIVFVVGIITYFMRGKYYDQIDILDQKKKEVFNQAPQNELEEVRELSLTGQSSELRDQFEKRWHEIESVNYPKLENYLYEAEQATDRYRLNESKKNQEHAEQMIEELEKETNKLSASLKELIEREQANLKKIDKIKQRYHEIRKSLLAYSFSFGPASESFEEKLNLMEEDFTEFSEYTVSGDHEEAKQVIKRLADNIQKTEEQMDQVPDLLTKINEEYQADIEDLQQGYAQMLEHHYIFPDDHISRDIEQLTEQKNQILESIRLLDLKAVNEYIDLIARNIDQVYEKMELEISSETKVKELLEDNKQAIYYLRDETRRLLALENRLAQSYVLYHNEKEKLELMENGLVEAIKEYEIIEEKISDQSIAYSMAHSRAHYLFKKLEKLNNEKDSLGQNLIDYRKEELNYKEEMHAMEEAMYDMKRALESQRLPGLPDDYLELFFSATHRIEKLAEELAQTKVALIAVRKFHQIAEEDVIQLSRMTEEIIDQVNLIERSSQRLYRFKDEHKGILETIRYSESLFNDDYDYYTSLRLLKEKLENVAPGVYSEILADYNKEKEL